MKIIKYMLLRTAVTVLISVFPFLPGFWVGRVPVVEMNGIWDYLYLIWITLFLCYVWVRVADTICVRLIGDFPSNEEEL